MIAKELSERGGLPARSTGVRYPKLLYGRTVL
jgi:hypothetical protein